MLTKSNEDKPEDRKHVSLFQTYNIFSHPQVSDDGQWISLVVDHHDRGTAIVRVSTQGKDTEELLYTKSEYISDASPSPRGEHIVYWSGSCAKCDKSVRVVSAGQTKPIQVLSTQEATTVRFLPEWSFDGKQLFFSGEREGFLRSVWSVTIPGLQFTPLAGNAVPPPDDKKSAVVEDAPIEAVRANEEEVVVDKDPPEYWLGDVSPDGKSLLLKERRDSESGKTYHLVELELGTGNITDLAQVDKRVQRIRYSPKGKQVAFRTRQNTNKSDTSRYDWEIGLLDRETKTLRTLTANNTDELFLDFGRWSGRILFATQGDYRSGPCGKYCNRIHWMER